MKLKKLSYVLLLFVSVFLLSCEKEETTSTDDDDDISDNSGSQSWADSSWKKGGSEVYMDLTSSTPKFCDNGSPVGGTYSALTWESDNIAFFTLFNAGDEVDFRIEKSGDNLILAPWDEIAQQTHNPSTYYRSSEFPCSTSGGGTGGGGTGGGGTGGGGTGGGGATDGDVIFWTSQNFPCSSISVSVSGVGSSSITGFFDSGIPDCSNTSGGGNFNDLAPGSYSFNASCENLTWSGSFTIVAGGCLRFQLQL